MCTNYRPTARDTIQAMLGVAPPEVEFKPEAYPGYAAPIVRRGEGSANEAIAATFGLIPPWSKTGKDFRHCYNARIETIALKPSFKHAWRARQFCVAPMDAFYEPNYATGKPIRWRIERKDQAPLFAAGIWEYWKQPATGEWVKSFSLVTINADPHPVMNQFHPPEDEKRMLVLLDASQVDAWMSGSSDDALALAQPMPAECLVATPSPLPPRQRASAESLPSADVRVD
jgi:putative SOS response-associated peptidase YedK